MVYFVLQQMFAGFVVHSIHVRLPWGAHLNPARLQRGGVSWLALRQLFNAIAVIMLTSIIIGTRFTPSPRQKVERHDSICASCMDLNICCKQTWAKMSHHSLPS